jgi:hypothetical protein
VAFVAANVSLGVPREVLLRLNNVDPGQLLRDRDGRDPLGDVGLVAGQRRKYRAGGWTRSTGLKADPSIRAYSLSVSQGVRRSLRRG